MPIGDLTLEASRVAIGLGLAVFLGSALSVWSLRFVIRRDTRFAESPLIEGLSHEVGEVLDQARFVAAGCLLVGVLLDVQTLGSALPERRGLAAALLFLLVASHVYSVMVVKPKMRYFQEKIKAPSAQDANDPWLRKLRREARKNERVMMAGVILAVAALVVRG